MFFQIEVFSQFIAVGLYKKNPKDILRELDFAALDPSNRAITRLAIFVNKATKISYSVSLLLFQVLQNQLH